jgi:hypothetical protein
MSTEVLANAKLKERQFRKRILFGATLIAFLAVVAMSGVANSVAGFLFYRRGRNGIHQVQYDDGSDDVLFLRRNKIKGIKLQRRKLRGLRGVTRRRRRRL